MYLLTISVDIYRNHGTYHLSLRGMKVDSKIYPVLAGTVRGNRVKTHVSDRGDSTSSTTDYGIQKRVVKGCAHHFLVLKPKNKTKLKRLGDVQLCRHFLLCLLNDPFTSV